MPSAGDPARIVGVLLAAGRGRRMGRTKQLMPWPPDGVRPLVAAAFDAVRAACDAMLVVVGHEADAVAAALGDRAFALVPADGDAEMYESVRAGLAAAQALDARAWALVHPADHPEVAPATLAALLAGRRDDPDRALLPVHGDRGGHPVLIPPALHPRLLEFPGTGGLRRYWLDHPACCRRVPVDDPSILRDLDTPGDVGPG